MLRMVRMKSVVVATVPVGAALILLPKVLGILYQSLDDFQLVWVPFFDNLEDGTSSREQVIFGTVQSSMI